MMERAEIRCAGCWGIVPLGGGVSEVVAGETKWKHPKCHEQSLEYRSMKLSPDYGFVTQRMSTDHRAQYIPDDDARRMNAFLDDESADAMFQGMTEYEFLGDVGDK